MEEDEKRFTGNFRDVAVLALAPGIVGFLILASWALAYWEFGPEWVNGTLALIATVLGGCQRLWAGFRDVYHRRITVNVFVTVALIATVSVGEFRAAAIIVFIMAIAGALESYTLDKTRRSIRNLLDLAPRTATVRQGEDEITIPVGEVQVADIVIVRPGEHIPVDGVVVAGASSVNQAPITGESMPVEKFKGSDVFSGTLNEAGRLEIRTVKTGDDTTLARIVHLVEEAQETKAPIQNTADRFTTWFLPTVVVLAVIGYLTSGDVKVAVSVLLVACPCAFAIATPTAVTAGISNMARRAVLVKGGIFFESAGRLDALLVDKTGTFTLGKPTVVEVVGVNGESEEEVLRLAAIAEKYSEHPLGRSVMSLANERNVRVPDPEDFKIETGMGVTARWKGKGIFVGKAGFLRQSGVAFSDSVERTVGQQVDGGRTAVLVARDAQVVGIIAIADEIRPGMRRAIASLKNPLGIPKIVMLTGDNAKVARSVAEEIGVDDFRAGLLPEDKQRFVKGLQDGGCLVGMVGDGINDAPSLALADVGIAMGAAGTDAAIEAADVTLMNDDLGRVVDFIWMSRKVLRRIKWNIFFSIAYNAMGLVLASLGMLTPVLAVVFQEAGCVTVVLSSTLLLWTKPNLVRCM